MPSIEISRTCLLGCARDGRAGWALAGIMDSAHSAAVDTARPIAAARGNVDMALSLGSGSNVVSSGSANECLNSRPLAGTPRTDELVNDGQTPVESNYMLSSS